MWNWGTPDLKKKCRWHMPPFFMNLLLSFLLLFLTIKASEILSEISGRKRFRDTDLEFESPGLPVTKRKIEQSSNLSISNFTDTNPPELFRSNTDFIYFHNLPPKFKEFSCIFRIAWDAHKIDFKGTGDCNFELMKWQDSLIVTELSLDTHLAFIQEILKQGSALNDNCWDLLCEYINFSFNHYCRDESISCDIFIELLVLSAEAINTQSFKVILKHRPDYILNESAGRIWCALITTALNRNLIVSSFSKVTSSWIEIFHLLSLNFGTFYNLTNYQSSNASNMTTFRLNQLIKLQPVLSAIANLDSDLFFSLFLSEEILQVVNEMGRKVLYFWFDRFLQLNQSIKCFEVLNEEKLSALADKLYICLCATNPLPNLIQECADHNCKTLSQFILMYSPYALKYIPSKFSQCQLLRNLVQVESFDFDFMKMITIIVGFDLKWKDLEEHLLPTIGNYKEIPLIHGLRFILQIAESFPEDFDPNFTNWTIPFQFPNLQVDPESPFLYDAARIILARQYKIIPVSTQMLEFGAEEACFRDLAWFMTFYINLYRPDLGPFYQIFVDCQ